MKSQIQKIIIAILICFIFIIQHVGAATYYVATDGDNSNSGTVSMPWETIQYAMNQLSAGDTVYVRGGVYNELVIVTVSGSEVAGSVMLSSYPGETAIIDGTGLQVDYEQALISLYNISYVTINGFELRNSMTDNKNVLPVGIYVSGYGTEIKLLNNMIHHIEQGNEANGNAHGIAVYGDSVTPITDITVAGNTIRNCKLGWSESLTLNGNINGFIIKDNIVHDNDNIGIDLIGWEGTAPADDQARNGIVSGNTVYNITSVDNAAYGGERAAGGIYVDGGRDIIIENNLIYQCDIGIEVGCEHKNKLVENITVRNNLIFRNYVTGIGLGGYANNRGIVKNSSFEHNTLFDNDTTNSGTGELMIQRANNNQIKNNIIYASAQNILITNYFTSDYSYNNTFDYNIYYTLGGEGACIVVWQNREYSTFTAYRAASSQDANTVFADPRFADILSTPPNLHLQLDSSAIDAGDPNFIPGVDETDYDGSSRIINSRTDFGAYEAVNGSTVALTLNITPAGTGSIDPEAGIHLISSGATVTVIAEPISGYAFDFWTATGNAAVTDNSSATTTVTISGDATVTAHFKEDTDPPIDVNVTLGMMVNVAAVDIEGLVAFSKTPQLYGTFYDPVKDPENSDIREVKLKVITKISANTPQVVVEAEWIKSISLYNKKSFKDAQDSGIKFKDFTGQQSSLAMNSFICLTDESNSYHNTLDAILVLMPPSITAVEYKAGGAAVKPNGTIVIRGKYFGSKPPKVWLEYLHSSGRIKLAMGKVLKPLKYVDNKGRAGKSCMNINTGDSEITIQLPKSWPKSGWVNGINSLVINNKIGMATIEIITE
jgi:Divergent InlB B-repeat domain/Right handed beta helix region